MVENTNSFVVDASYVLSILIPDEQDLPEYQKAQKLFKNINNSFHAPELIVYEVGNAIKLALKRKRINRKQAKIVLEIFEKFPIEYNKVDLMETFEMARKFDLTFYDASYLYLSLKNDLSLLTKDKRLQIMSR